MENFIAEEKNITELVRMNIKLQKEVADMRLKSICMGTGFIISIIIVCLTK